MVSSLGSNSHNKRFKRDSQRAAFLLCVGFCDYDVMRKVGSGVVCPLTGRYVIRRKLKTALIEWAEY